MRRQPRVSVRRLHGFTLVELMAVVVMVSTAAALAIPQITKRLRDRRVQEAAHLVAGVYRSARLRAMGRGSAVLVRFTGGAYVVREAQRGSLESDAACATLPVSSCTGTNWNDPGLAQFRELPGLNIAARAEYGTGAGATSIALRDQGDSAVAALDVCFTPLGRAFARTDVAQTLTPLASAHTATVSRSGYRARNVLILPSGSARLL